MADLTVGEAIVVLTRLQRVRVSPPCEQDLPDSPDKLKQNFSRISSSTFTV